MKCPECEATNSKSLFFPSQVGFATAMGVEQFYDEEGRLHVHDGNSFTSPWHC